MNGDFQCWNFIIIFLVGDKIYNVTYISLGMKLDEILLPFEAELSDLGPRESVDFCAVLEDENTHMRHGQIEWDTFVILK